MIAGSSHSRSLSKQIPTPAQIMSSVTSIFFIVRDFCVFHAMVNRVSTGS